MYKVPFNWPSFEGQEQTYMAQAVANGHISGDGPFTQKCREILEKQLGAPRVLLTPSGTHALELIALLLDAQEVLLGQSASLWFRIANVRDHPQDRAPAPAGVRVRAALIQNGRQLAQVEFRTRRPIEAGRSESPPADFALRVPAQAEEGPALVRLEVDPPTDERPRGDVRESNEADNIVELPLRLKMPLPDLVVEAARFLAPGDPPTLVIGAPTALFFLIANRGEGTADPATHEISLVFTITIGPFPLQLHAPLRTVETSRLGRGRFAPFLVTLSVPPVVQLPGLPLPIPVPPGPAAIRITADSERSVEETDEDNNMIQIPVVLVSPP